MKLNKKMLREIIQEVITEADVMDKKIKYKDKEGNEKEATVGGIIKQGEDHPAYKKAKQMTDKGGEDKPKAKATKISADPFAKDDAKPSKVYKDKFGLPVKADKFGNTPESPQFNLDGDLTSDDEEDFDSGGPSYANVPKGAKTSKQAKAMKAKEKSSGDTSKDEKKAKHDGLFKQGLDAGGSADYFQVQDVVKSMKSEEEKDEYLGYLKKEHKRREVVSKKLKKKSDIVWDKMNEVEDKMMDAEDKSESYNRAGNKAAAVKYIKLRDKYEKQLSKLEEKKEKLGKLRDENWPDDVKSTMEKVKIQSDKEDQKLQWGLNKSTQSHPEEIRAVTGTPPFQLGQDDHDAILTKVDKAIEYAKKNGASEESISSLEFNREELNRALEYHKGSAASSTSNWHGTYPIKNPMVTVSLSSIQFNLLGTDNPKYDAADEQGDEDSYKTTPMPWNQKKEESITAITSKLKREFKEYDIYNKNLRKI